MDELKLLKWREDFSEEAKKIQTAYPEYFQGNDVKSVYTLEIDEVAQTLMLHFTDTNLPADISTDLNTLFTNTKPEDSI